MPTTIGNKSAVVLGLYDVDASYKLAQPDGEITLEPDLQSSQVIDLLSSAGLAGSTPSNTVAPAIAGNAKVGQLLTCSSGTWLNSQAVSYQWQLVDGSSVTNISGEKSATYTVISGQIGKKLRCSVTATNGFGSSTVSAANTADVVE